jgi:hypothetical protein
MKSYKYCRHCGEEFTPRRSNHIYCKTSCKTLASYKRNQYSYVPGHYKKNQLEVLDASNLPTTDSNITELFQKLESKIDSLNTPNNKSSIANNALGSVTADTGIYLAKKLLAPNLLNANKGDIENLRKDLQELKELLKQRNNNFFSNGF